MTKFDVREVSGQRLILGDCREVLRDRALLPQVDVVVTSPNYNVGTKYSTCDDKKNRFDYLAWMEGWFSEVSEVLDAEGSLFLNVGHTCTHPWVAMDVIYHARPYFQLQNHLIWVKSIRMDAYERPGIYDAIGRTYGHSKPINSKRFLNNNFEHLFHLTKTGNVEIDRLAVGCPYEDKSNLRRGTRGKNGDVRCRGNVLYVPYETVQSRGEKGNHPAIFPVALAEYCVKLHGVREGLVVLDPFVGSGSTLAACKNLGVAGVGIDLDAQYLDWAYERLK